LASAHAFYNQDNTGSSETDASSHNSINALAANVNSNFGDDNGGSGDDSDNGSNESNYDDNGEAQAEGADYQRNNQNNGGAMTHSTGHSGGGYGGSPVTINIEGLGAGKINGQEWNKGDRHPDVYMPATPLKECAGGFEKVGDKCLMVAPIKATRGEAARYCQAFHSHLVAPHNPYENYQLKYHIHSHNMSDRTFWTSGRKVEGNWVWENSKKQVDYDHWETPTKLEEDEMSYWESNKNDKDEEDDAKQDKMKDVDNQKFMEPLSDNCRCIILGPGDGDVVWKDEKCKDTKAHFICQKPRRKPHHGNKHWKNFNWGNGKSAEGHVKGMMDMMKGMMENAMVKKGMEHEYVKKFKKLGTDKAAEFMKDYAPKMVDKAHTMAESYMTMGLQMLTATAWITT